MTVGVRTATWLACVGTLAVLAVPATARAQQWQLAGEATLGAGFEGGGDPKSILRRTRTSARFGVEARVDERPHEAFSAGILMELEPKTSFGLDVRYVRTFSPRWSVDGGAIGFLTPHTLFGATAGATFHTRPSAGFSFVFGPRANIFFGGTDLPTDRPIWQLLATGGVHVDLL